MVIPTTTPMPHSLFTKISSSILAISLLVGGSVYAQTADQLKSNVDALSAQIQSLDKEIAEYNKKIQATQGEAKTLKQALANLESRKAILAKEIDRTRLQIKSTEGRIVDTQGRILETEEVITRNAQALKELFRNVTYSDGALPPLFSVMTASGNLSDTFDSIKRSTDISNEVHRKVKELKEAKTTLESAKQSYESSKKQLETLTSSLADQKTLVEQNAKEKNTLLVQTKNKETEYQKMLSDRQKKKGELEAELSDVESKLQTTVDAGKLPKYGKGVLQYPVANVKITQYFGNTPFASKNPQVYNGGGHNGIDFGIPTGTTIMSAQSGVVLGTGNTDTACNGVSYGKWVLVKHNNGLTTLYAHLSVISVSGGQSVSAGQKLGLSGNTGYSTGPHLHFTVYASDAVEITNYRSKVCGTNMTMPIAPKPGYLNPLSYL